MPMRVFLCAFLAAPARSVIDSVDDLHAHYGEIFPSHNRNAASHLWATYIFQQSTKLSTAKLTELFSGFCPVSGSPVRPFDGNRYQYELDRLGGGRSTGVTYHCCAPCVCDTTDFLMVDSKSVQTADGLVALDFLVVGDPCENAAALQSPFVDPFSGTTETLQQVAPELRCDASGKLHGASYSDHGGVIVGMLAHPSQENGDTPAQLAASFSGYCTERASSGFASGMGLIFRAAAAITPLRAKLVNNAANGATNAFAATSPPPPAASACDSILPASRVSEINALIANKPVVMFGMPHMRCTMAAAERLERANACFHWEQWTDAADPIWTYFQCLHPHEIVGGMQMHSYVYIGGEYIGNGFKLDPRRNGALSDGLLSSKLAAAKAEFTCHKDCSSLAPKHDLEQLEMLKSQPIALLGWTSCPCTNIARQRFESVGACYVQVVWPEPTAPLYKYLQCVHGEHHHSFVFFGGEFVGDGFALAEDRMAQPHFEAAVAQTNARRTCAREGDSSLVSDELKSCTQSNDGSTTGWTRTGSCNWDPSDSGYHEVCVTMSDEFLKQSATHDSNDLSSVVQAGGHWCICAWAWASAVQRDPRNFEGITLECERTNAKLREVYQSYIDAGADLHSPSGAAYKAKEALDAVNRVCGDGSGAKNGAKDGAKGDGASTGKATASAPKPKGTRRNKTMAKWRKLRRAAR
mmetsp:Transcript_15723/g.33460  ORF Transcript_15723/g.33460 Transcript_15723/m.33460 type:complete len:694 (+) Transcript_15723:136-2217(+)